MHTILYIRWESFSAVSHTVLNISKSHIDVIPDIIRIFMNPLPTDPILLGSVIALAMNRSEIKWKMLSHAVRCVSIGTISRTTLMSFQIQTIKLKLVLTSLNQFLMST